MCSVLRQSCCVQLTCHDPNPIVITKYDGGWIIHLRKIAVCLWMSGSAPSYRTLQHTGKSFWVCNMSVVLRYCVSPPTGENSTAHIHDFFMATLNFFLFWCSIYDHFVTRILALEIWFYRVSLLNLHFCTFLLWTWQTLLWKMCTVSIACRGQRANSFTFLALEKLILAWYHYPYVN